MEARSTVKDHVLKKCPWFYNFEDIFHKDPTISFPILIKSEKPACRNGANINDSELGGFGLNLEKALETHEKVEDIVIMAIIIQILTFILFFHRVHGVMKYKNNG